MKKLYIVSNDKIWTTKKNYTSNNDLNNIISCLNKNYDLHLICRKSRKKLNFLIKTSFKYCDLNKISQDKIKIMLISITPYNFFILVYLIYFKRFSVEGFVYLRSDGFLEYKYRYGFIGYFIYFLMFSVIKKYLRIISCSKNFTNVDIKKIVHPSELNSRWFIKEKKKSFKTDFLYIGRFKRDKGAFYLAEQFKNFLHDYSLTIIGTKKKSIPKKFYSKNIKYLEPISDINKLIDFYDKSRIFILPSFIEGFPKVISESLARSKPVIIFEDIKYVIHGRKGIFVCKRNEKSLRKTTKHILKNYKKIQTQIKKNYFFTKKKFMKELLNSVNS